MGKLTLTTTVVLLTYHSPMSCGVMNMDDSQVSKNLYTKSDENTSWVLCI